MLEEFAMLPAVSLPVRSEAQLEELLEDARRRGGDVRVAEDLDGLRYAIITKAAPACASRRATSSRRFSPSSMCPIQMLRLRA